MKNIKNIAFYVGLLLVMVLVVSLIFSGTKDPRPKYSEILNYFKTEAIKSFEIDDYTLKLQLKTEETIEYELYSVTLFWAAVEEDVAAQIESGSMEYYDMIPPKQTPFWVSFIPYLLFGVVILLFWFFMMNQMNGGGGKGAMSFAKARLKVNEGMKKKVRFADVAGADEEKEELTEVVEFLKNPDRFRELGARIPRGILMVGSPGTGKTYMAKATAGEAGVPFFSISGSDFVELYVGVGASRVRDTFDQAKKNSPCIVFIDEIDAVGRQRGAGLGGGHDEREQTLNQLLVEMDGFEENEGVIVMAATNRPDILDPALLRPGRFDRQIVINLPDAKARQQILEIHAKSKPMAEDVSLETISKSTAGFSPAELENVLNEAALLAARRKHTKISMNDIEDAILKVVVGVEKKTRVISEKERRLTAFHEAGHAIINKNLSTQNNVHQISIVPRGMAGGYTLSLPKEDKSYMSKNEMFEEIISLLGGRVAEALCLDDISTGASNDIERATAIARKMVTKYGMSEKLGTIAFGSGHDEVFLGRDFSTQQNYSEKVASQIDDEIKSIVDNAYTKAKEILNANMDALNRVAERLLEKEKVSAEEFERIFQGESSDPDPKPNPV